MNVWVRDVERILWILWNAQIVKGKVSKESILAVADMAQLALTFALEQSKTFLFQLGQFRFACKGVIPFGCEGIHFRRSFISRNGIAN